VDEVDEVDSFSERVDVHSFYSLLVAA